MANNLQAEAALYLPDDLNNCFIADNKGQINLEEFLSLTPKKIKEKTGKKLTLKQVFILKKAQKKLKKELRDSTEGEIGKSQVTAFILAIFLGIIGAHRFYLGYTFHRFLYLLTFGGCMVMAVIDLILIATGNLQPKHGHYTESLD